MLVSNSHESIEYLPEQISLFSQEELPTLGGIPDKFVKRYGKKVQPKERDQLDLFKQASV